MDQLHQAGFVSIIGKPNVGKSTLMNGLMGENLSITTAKAQTTRHRIRGVLSGTNFQIIYSDTPGLLIPRYALHNAMMSYVKISLEDADLILIVVEPNEVYDKDLASYLERVSVPLILVINKIDLIEADHLKKRVTYWQDSIQPDIIIPISALHKKNMDLLLGSIITRLPHHPAYYPKDELTDRSERFFAAEIIREKVFLLYNQEIPYSVEVVIESFKDQASIIHIQALLFVERNSQKGIIIGKGGEAVKRVGTEARKEMECFFCKKIFLEMRVKVAEHWRKNKHTLKRFGYLS